MDQQRCPYCLNLSDQGICPHCGGERDAAAAENTLAHARSIGSILSGRYQLGRVMGRNAESITYIAYDMQENTRVEVHEYFPGALCSRGGDGSVLVSDEKLLAYKSLLFDFTDMYKAVAECENRGLVKVQEIFLADATAYAVTELCDLPTLERYVRENGALSVVEAKKIMLQICSALTPVHRMGLLHGGISPRNILVDEMSDIRLTGFSTLSLRTLGSGIDAELYPGFSAPEQYAANKWQGSWTDVYAIGATAYYMLTGSYLPSAQDRTDADPFPEGKFPSGIPANICRTVNHALKLDSDHRIRSIEEFSSGILQSQQGDTSVFSIKANETLILDEQTRVVGKVPARREERTMVLPDGGEGAAVSPRRQHSRRWIAAMVLLFLALCVGAAVLFSGLIGGFHWDLGFLQSGEPQRISFPEPNIVPSLEGRHIDTITSNEEWNEQFQFSIRYTYDDNNPEGIVIDQGPDAGVKMLNRGTIILTVSKGAQNVPMPNIVGSRIDFAFTTLTEMGIRYVVIESTDYPEGIVGSTSVPEGQTVDRVNDTIYVTIGQHEVKSSLDDDESTSIE
ncbi:MAG: PASTA domain-containing protein [Clostridiales bacterium]|nr:PASTA domain-containing protein [Clostridiales bacterium]